MQKSMASYGYGVLLLVLLLMATVQGKDQNAPKISENASEFEGTRWAVLVAGSKGYGNYRHQADVCHAYQILKKGGLKDENIIVFMYDDIAYNQENPRQGVIINRPEGEDVYNGVPKDYNGENVTANNFFAVLLGNKTALTGGSGKVVESGPNDHIFIFYSDHGAPGLVEMAGKDGIMYAIDLADVLKQKYEANSYKTMVFYLEACESGSMFDGLITEDMNIWAVTASNATENSWGYYCPDFNSTISQEYNTCLGDLFSISWLEDSDSHNMRNETLWSQFEAVKNRTGNFSSQYSSHVMHYGTMKPQNEFLVDYIGTNPENDNYIFHDDHHLDSLQSSYIAIDQRNADLHHLLHKFYNAPKSSREKTDAQKTLQNEIAQRKHIDSSIVRIATFLFGEENSSNMLTSTRRVGASLVDDWDCFKTLVMNFKEYCSSSTSYGIKYSGVLANICNAKGQIEKAVSVIREVCSNT